MSDTDPELAAALVDVRRAWRLVYAYQRRVNDLLALVDTALGAKGFAFQQWRPSRFSPPARTGTPFFRAGTWAWDMLPGYQMWVEWTRWDAKRSLARRVTVEVTADSGFRKGSGEPDPAEFVDAVEAESVLWIGYFTADAKSPDWPAAWAALTQLPFVPGELRVVDVGGVRYTHRAVAEYLEDMPEPADVTANVVQPILEWSNGDQP